jgi:iron complex outermembrane receptor protein
MFGNMYADNANKTIINDYKKIDLTIFKDFNISSKNWNGFISINNLTNTKYFDNIRINAFGSRYYEPASGLNFMLGIRK